MKCFMKEINNIILFDLNLTHGVRIINTLDNIWPDIINYISLCDQGFAKLDIFQKWLKEKLIFLRYF